MGQGSFQDIKMLDDKKENLIKIIKFDNKQDVTYLISSLLEIINRWEKIRIYIYDIKGADDGKKL